MDQFSETKFKQGGIVTCGMIQMTHIWKILADNCVYGLGVLRVSKELGVMANEPRLRCSAENMIVIPQ